MSPRKRARESSGTVTAAVTRLRVAFGLQIRDARIARGWSVQDLARRADLSPAFVYLVEAGRSGSAEAAARLAVALGRRAELQLVDPRRRAERGQLSADPVHSAMGELEAAHLRQLGYGVGVDEPYQHYQFAGRSDVVAWDVQARVLLHIENRTRFPDFQDMAGSYNAKRAYLAESLGRRLGVRRWASETHVIAALWSSEVLHALRMRPDSFRSLCPDAADAFAGWWRGEPPPSGATSTLVVIDPVASRRQRLFIGLDEALAAARPRHRGYAEVAAALPFA